MATLYLALGSNVGNRAEAIRTAVHLLTLAIGPCTALSECIENTPVGFVSPHTFLNAVAVFTSSLSPLHILQHTQRIEREMGRSSQRVKGEYQDRCIDIDLLLYDEVVMQTDTLTLPHPHMAHRLFVLYPLAQIAPTLQHPVLRMSIQQLLDACTANLPPAERPQALVEISLQSDLHAAAQALQPLMHTLNPSIPPPTVQRLTALLRQPHVHIYLLYRFGIPCGTFTLIVNPALSGTKVWLEDVAVLPHRQGEGLGRTLMHYAKQLLTELGTDKMLLTSRPTRIHANALYQKVGFVLRETNVYQYVPSQPPYIQ